MIEVLRACSFEICKSISIPLSQHETLFITIFFNNVTYLPGYSIRKKNRKGFDWMVKSGRFRIISDQNEFKPPALNELLVGFLDRMFYLNQ